MQIYNNGHEIYKNVGVVHAVAFADRAREAKNAQVVGEKIAIGTVKRAIKANKMITHALFEAVWGSKK